MHHLTKSSITFAARTSSACVLGYRAHPSPFAARIRAMQDLPPLTEGAGSSEIQAGIASLQHNDAAAAKLRFSAALRADPAQPTLSSGEEIAENQLKQFGNAEQDFTTALRIDPNRLPAHYNLALSLIRLGENERAIDELRIVAKAQPGLLEPEYNLAILLEQQHQLDEAIDHLSAAHRTRPMTSP